MTIGVRFSEAATPHPDLDPALLAIMKNQADGPSGLDVEFRIGDSVISTTSSPADRAQARHRITLLKASGSARLWALGYWIRPLPDADLALAATWPAADVRARHVSVSHAAIASASRDVVSLFP